MAACRVYESRYTGRGDERVEIQSEQQRERERAGSMRVDILEEGLREYGNRKRKTREREQGP